VYLASTSTTLHDQTPLLLTLRSALTVDHSTFPRFSRSMSNSREAHKQHGGHNLNGPHA
jgi:hypothetical protein